MHKPFAFASALFAVAALTTASSAEANFGAFHVRGAYGGASGVAGARGVAGRAHGTYYGADGSVTHASGGAFRGVNGSNGYRASATTVNPDGSISRQGQLSASGARGSVNSAGGFTRSADGSWSGSRSTTATNNQTGVSYAGSTSIDPTTGKPVHSGSCADASGAAVACH